MKITKKEDHYLFESELGTYHLSLEDFSKFGEKAAIEFVESELKKKSEGVYTDDEIDFKRAKDLGFCDWGIKDFCKRLNLNITKTYKISELVGALTPDVFLSYHDEITKIAGKDVINKFGGPKKFLEDNKTRGVLNLVFRKHLPLKDSQKLACEFAFRVLPIFEEKHPDDKRPRIALEATVKYLNGKATKKEAEKATQAAYAAYAAYAASYAAAAYATQAAYAAHAAAATHASDKDDKELEWQINRTLEVME